MQEYRPRQGPSPVITYPADLPVAELRDEISRTIAEHQVVIIAGETGSGKTTQLPKICLELGRGQNGRIGHTQPRRLAARTVAARIAEELGTEPGDLVGYQVRFHDSVSEFTTIKLMTDGILLAEIERDRQLRQYDTLIIDEAHERSLNIDFLLGYLTRLLPQRPDLKVIVTSATIDVDSFSRHFSDAPIIEVSGRTYPVETVYREPAGEGEDRASEIASLVEDIDAEQFGPRGDVLVFLPGERDIRETARKLRDNSLHEILPLYARLSQAEQNRVFGGRRKGGMRVVLATNVAETSLTVPGIRYVIDPGDARISRYSFRSKLQRLPIEPISQASADQRRGRCGRVGPGVCIRLYSEQDYLARPEYTEPEIHRTNLSAVVLQMLQLGLGEVEHFPFINPPDSRLVRDGYRLLEELGAVSVKGKLTRLGQRMARLPVDPRLARMILAAQEEGCLAEVLIICSALSVQDPRERPAEKQAQADQMHARFKHPRSDFLASLNLWRYYEEQRQDLSQNQLRKLCKREYLSYLRMREWRDVHTQLRIACRQQKMNVPAAVPVEENYVAVHRALLSGLLSNIARHQESREYLGARNRKLEIFPGSSQSRKNPPWIVAAEIVETSKVFARVVAAIEPDWVLALNPPLLKRHYSEPHWRASRGQVVALERVVLYGLTLAEGRPVHYGPQARRESRELMIREGLIPGNFNNHPAFLKKNRRLVRDVEELESRSRRRDILVDENAQFAFYDERLPEDVCTASGLQAWLKREPAAASALEMRREQLLARDPAENLENQFPDTLRWQDMALKLSYQFEPGGEADGVSVTVPVALLNRVPRYRFDWLVPGLLREKCIALVKGLPKHLRKHLVPVPDHVDRALDLAPEDDTDLLAWLSKNLSQGSTVSLSITDWNPARLEDYYRMNVRVVDAQGRLLGQGRNLAELVSQFREDTRAQISNRGDDSPAREGIERWNFDDLPREWRFRQAGSDIVSYPALVDRGDDCAIELCDYPPEALRLHRLGVLRLVRLGAATEVRFLRRQMLRGNDYTLALAAADLAREPLIDGIIDAAYIHAMGLDEGLPYTQEAFACCVEKGAGKVVSQANEVEQILFDTVSTLGACRQQLAAIGQGKWPD
ncbi:MAG: ATP-dependent helicase HrpA, partial [Bacteroidia bacterium]